MKLIFLDIDGVLNSAFTTAKSPTGCKGIEVEKLRLLKTIVDETGAEIVLTSTWKTDWCKTDTREVLSKDGQYLVNMFEKAGLYVYDKTLEATWSKRGVGITDYLKNSPEPVESFVILDDEMFDYKIENLDKYVVKTKYLDLSDAVLGCSTCGLQPHHVETAIRILNNKVE